MHTHKIRFLHISDLHARGNREVEHWRRRRVLGSAWGEHLAELAGDGPIDFVCFTGDVADWGLPDEYAAATEFLEETLAVVGLTKSRLYAIPGNHDVNRKTAVDAWTTLRASFPSLHEQAISRWMAGILGGPGIGIDTAHRTEVLARQAAYRQWVTDGLRRPDLCPSNSRHGTLGYRSTLKLDRLPFAIELVGLDTSWLAGDDQDVGSLRVTEDQVMLLLTDHTGRPLPGFRLVMMHHPFAALADGTRARALVYENADLLLRGHLHKEELLDARDPDRRGIELAAGCLYEPEGGDAYPNACHLITVSLSDSGRPLNYDIRFRGWSPGGHWYDDGGLYKRAKAGRFSFSVPEGPSEAVPRTRFSQLYPVDAVNALEALTRDRNKAARDESTSLRELRTVSIDSLVSKLTEIPSPRTHDEVAGARLVRFLKAGLFGQVWQAVDVDSGEQSAVKIFDRYRLGAELALYHFRRGVRVMRHLSDCKDLPSSIVRLRSCDPSDLAFSMEYLDGGDLSNAPERGWTLEKKLAVFADICDGASFAHKMQIIHRDLKPANVVLSNDGRVAITDFDIADLLYVQTLSSQSSGTLAYAAPENLRRQGNKHPTEDVYSLGRILHFLLLGRDPLYGVDQTRSVAELAGHAPPHLINVIRRSTRTDPHDRYQTVDELSRELRESSRRPQSAPRARRRLATIGVLAALVGAGAFVWVTRPQRTHLAPAVASTVEVRMAPSGSMFSAAAVGSAERPSSEIPPPATPSSAMERKRCPSTTMILVERHDGAADRSFCLDEAEVTVSDYADCVDRDSSPKCVAVPVSQSNYTRYRGGDMSRQFHPMNYVSWEESQVYCSVYGKRLPTDWEWSYAASGGGRYMYPWGNSNAYSECTNGLGTCAVKTWPASPDVTVRRWTRSAAA